MFRSRLTDAPLIVAAVLLGGLAVAVAAATGVSILAVVVLGVAVGAIVYAVAAGLDRMLDRSRPGAPVPAPETRRWLERAAAAAATLRRQRSAAGDPGLARLLTDAATHASTMAGRLRERASALAVVAAAAAGTERDQLRREAERLDREAAELPSGRLRAEKESAARAAAERLASYERLADIRALLLASIESSVLQLEAVAARGSVLLSMGAAGGAEAGATDLAPLTAELAAAQETLEQTEEITRQLLGQAPG
jgi:hypothetical protein